MEPRALRIRLFPTERFFQWKIIAIVFLDGLLYNAHPTVAHDLQNFIFCTVVKIAAFLLFDGKRQKWYAMTTRPHARVKCSNLSSITCSLSYTSIDFCMLVAHIPHTSSNYSSLCLANFVPPASSVPSLQGPSDFIVCLMAREMAGDKRTSPPLWQHRRGS